MLNSMMPSFPIAVTNITVSLRKEWLDSRKETTTFYLRGSIHVNWFNLSFQLQTGSQTARDRANFWLPTSHWVSPLEVPPPLWITSLRSRFPTQILGRWTQNCTKLTKKRLWLKLPGTLPSFISYRISVDCPFISTLRTPWPIRQHQKYLSVH